MTSNFRKVPAAKRYEKAVPEIQAMQADIDILKKVVTGHSEKLITLTTAVQRMRQKQSTLNMKNCSKYEKTSIHGSRIQQTVEQN